MAIKPILFNTEMVRAILDGRKACTRRVVKPTPKYFEVKENPVYIYDAEPAMGRIYPPCQPEDVLYVRETWGIYTESWLDADYFMYKADYPANATTYTHQEGNICDLPRWRPSIHMPKEAARIWLKVTDVRVERLQDITEDGAKVEGAIDNRGLIHSPNNEYDRIHTAREHFIGIWDSTINKSDIDIYGWDANPWVWVISFGRCEKPEVV